MHHAAALNDFVLVNLPLADEHAGLVEAQLGPARALAPRDWHAGAHACESDCGRELHADHPVGKRRIELQSGRVMVQRLAQPPHVVVALAHHRVVGNRIDPTRLRRLDRAAVLRLELAQSVFIFAVVELAKRRHVAETWNAPLLAVQRTCKRSRTDRAGQRQNNAGTQVLPGPTRRAGRQSPKHGLFSERSPNSPRTATRLMERTIHPLSFLSYTLTRRFPNDTTAWGCVIGSFTTPDTTTAATFRSVSSLTRHRTITFLPIVATLAIYLHRAG